MLVLAIDTATTVAAIALVEGDRLVAEEVLNIPQKTHSERLLPTLDRLLTGAGKDLKQVDAFAVSAGPGSFTGLRIGMGTAKGLAHALGRPLVTIPTLDALAFNYFLPGALTCPLVDAKQGYIYTALYRGGEFGVERVSSYLALTPSQVARQLQDTGEGLVILTGDGIELCREALADLTVPVFVVPALSRLPRAASVGFLAAAALREGRRDDVFGAKPLYVRKSAAEINLEKRLSCGPDN